MSSNRSEQLQAFGRLLDIMDELREKCPWDRKQTMESLRHLTIEEVYELGDAILDNDLSEVRKELGDIMLHMVFYSRLGQEQGAFDVADVLNGICEKLIQRHPHIYGDVQVHDEEEVKQNWEKLKMKEGRESVLEGVPRSLPAMVKATRIQDKAKGVGFDWEEKEQVWEKVQEELAELREAESSGVEQHVEEELGDVLFSVINYARFLKMDPESALERTNKKFIGRFTHMERQIKEQGLLMQEMSLSELEAFWRSAKTQD
ncbi:MAG: Nucleoside triphosphate pyrophosphohydrolase [Flavobacteriia bacterium]|nr:MAG: Nucleoside triphosphate pyrophosphohydrolase [Flavobacteriia bacterium]